MFQGNILAVGGDVSFAREIKATLPPPTYSLTYVPDPEQAFQALGEKEFWIFVVHALLPNSNAVDFLEHVHEIRPASRIMLVTHVDDFHLAALAVNRGGASRIFNYPLNGSEIRQAVDSAVYQIRDHLEFEHLQTRLQQENTELAIKTINLDREIHERTMSLLDGLIMALDLRDAETQWHSQRVAQYSHRIAKQMNVKGDELHVVDRGALLHDIGKIGVPDSILLKPGPLTEDEWKEMRKHPQMGYQLLAGADFLEDERIIVLHHQERYDGKGYPAGLHARDIAVGARIFHIADTFDAMTSDRPYRKGRSFKTAREEIIRHSGAQFDPRVVESFLSIPQPEWQEIRAEVERGEVTKVPDPFALSDPAVAARALQEAIEQHRKAQ